ncbi:MAG: phosphohistidine phosphatase [Acidobacteria bacterium]|nr:MAG: phosphohistidine phosphatase [Acidobacteriota bacterium]
MKTLYVLRHAKSSWDEAGLSDFDRPLNKRGTTTAPFMGETMASNGFEPDVIVSSPAVRARETSQLVKEAARMTVDIIFDERIYEASARTLQLVASSIDDRFESAMIVGHNPGMEGLIRLLTGKSEEMPTAALAIIDLDIEHWNEIDSGLGELRRIIRPKEEMKLEKRDQRK